MKNHFPPKELIKPSLPLKSRLKQARVLEFEPLEPRILFAADPVATVENLPTEEMVNEEISFDIQFDNQGTDTLPGSGTDATGFKPYVDFTAPPEMQITNIEIFGQAGNNPGGTSLTPIGEINAAGDLVQVGTTVGGVGGTAVDHPEYAGNPPSSFGTIGSNTAPVQYDVVGNPNLVGQLVYSVSLPFGSFSENNPPVSVNVTGRLDTINANDPTIGVVPSQTLDVFAQGGFAFGVDALDNPLVDTPLSGALSSSTIDPQVLNLVKSANVREEEGLLTGESASGPNHPITYTLALDVATTEDIAGLVITDSLPDDLAYLGNLQVRDGAGTLLTVGTDYTINSEPNVTSDGISAVNSATNTLSITMIGNVTGVAGNDIVVTYDTFVPYVESDGTTLVVDPITGDEGDLDPIEYNDAAASGTYDHPLAGIGSVTVTDDDGPLNPADLDGETDYRIEEHSLAVQKSVALIADNNAAGVSPFDVLEYTVDFQLSDYFAVDNLIVTDALGDGQEFLFGTGADPDGVIPVLDFQMQGVNISVAFDLANVNSTFNNTTGETTIIFDVYQQLIDSGFVPANGGGTGTGGALQTGDALLGAFIPVGGLGAAVMGSFDAGTPTLGSLTFRARIRDNFTDTGTGEQEISQGDSLGNDVVIDARNLDVNDLLPIGAIEQNGSSAGVQIAVGDISKAVFSVTDRNGNTTLVPAGTQPPAIQLAVGDIITYVISYDLPLSEFESFVMDDFLPQPIFDVGTIDATQVYAYNAATYTTAGRISYGLGDTFFGDQGSAGGDGGISDLPAGYTPPTDPTIDTALFAQSNGIRIDVGSYQVGSLDPVATSIQFLISVEVQDAAFADGLLFTNQVGATESNTTIEASETEAIAGSQITAPELRITKGVVSTDKVGAAFTVATGPSGVIFNGPGSVLAFSGTIDSAGLALTPIDSDITGLDGGDLVTFVIVAENLGSGQYGAFDVTLGDTAPGSFVDPTSGAGQAALNLRVTDGNGATLTFTGDLFAGTFQLDDPAADQGALTEFDATSATNLVVIAYDLIVDTDAEAGSLITNTATLSNFAAVEGGVDYTLVDLTDDASATIVGPQINKVLVGTEVTDTGNNVADEAVVGELVTYRVTLTVPEGTTVGAILRDTLDPGLAFVDILSVTSSAGLTISNSNTPGTGSSPANVTVGNANGGTGNLLTMNLGDIVNSNTDEGATETVVIEYRAVVLNTNSVPSSPGNQGGTQLNNVARLSFTWTDDTSAATAGSDEVSNASANVTVVEPDLTVDKQVSATNTAGSYSNALTGVDAGDTVFYRIQISNAAGSPTAFETELEDTLPALANVTSIVSVSGGGFLPADFQIVGGVLSTVAPIDVVANTTIEIVVQGQLAVGVQPNQLIQNTADIKWTSIDGAPGTRSIHNVNSTERTGEDGVGADGTVLNNYAASDGANVRIDVPVNVKSIVNTSESFTGLVGGTERVAVGEIVRYRLQVEIPEGTSPDLQILDRLRPGMVFINDGTATVAFVTAGNDLSSSTLGTSPNVGTAIVQPTFVLPDAAVSRFISSNNDDYNSSTDVRFKLGDLVNNNTDDASSEYIIIEFNALVLNSTGNQSNTLIRNDFQTRINGNTPVGSTSNQANVRVAEPNLVVTKTASTVGPVDAGDTFTYTVTIANNASGSNAAPAFDVRLQDVLDEITASNPTLELELVSPPTGTLGGFTGNDVTLAGMGASTVLTNASNNAGLDLTFNRINAGQTVTLTVQVRVVTGALAGAEIENTATVSYTSLPGASGTEDATIAATYGTTDVDLNPGTDSVLVDADANNGTVNLGANAGERTGADVPNPTDNSAPADNSVRNNYAVAASSPADLTIAVPTIDKLFQDGTISADDSTVASSSGADLVVGEQITYDILVTLPEGVTRNVRVEDVLPAGLRIDNFSIITNAGVSALVTANLDGSIATTPASSSLNGAGTLTMDFDDITVNVGAVAASANQFVIRVTATVTNVIGNQQTVTRDNTARLLFEDPDRASNSSATPGDVTIADLTDNTTITVREPTLAITKSVDNAAADAGDTLTYTISISNNSGQVAYESKVQDILDPNLDGATANILSSGFLATGFAAFTAPTAADFEVVPVTAANIGDFTSAVSTGDYVVRVNPLFDLDIPDGASVTFDFDAEVSTSIVTGTSVINEADVSWTSTEGANADERDGSDDPDPGASQSSNLDNYAISSSIETTVVNPIIVSKVVTATSDTDTSGRNVTIGEIVTYRIAVSLPEGTTPELVLTDELPVGLAYIPGSAVLTAARPGGAALNAAHPGTGTAAFNGTYNGATLDTTDMAITPAVSLDGTDMVFTFASPFVVAGDNDVNNNTFFLTYDAVVTDNSATTGLLTNQDTLDNNVLYETRDAGGTVTSSGTGLTDPDGKILTVQEPNLRAIKSVTVGSIVGQTQGDAGDAVDYQIVIEHEGNSLNDAFELTFSDVLPPQIGDTVNSALTMSSVTVTLSGVGNVNAQFEIVAGVLQTNSTADIDLAQGETLTIDISGILLQSVAPGTSFDNQASFTYTNRDGDFTDPTYNPTPDITTDRERTVSEDSNVVTVAVPSFLELTKTLVSTSETGVNDTAGNDLAIGETALFRLGVTLEEGTTSVLTLTDTTPLGMRYVAGGAGSGVFFRSVDGMSATGFNSNTVYTDGDEIAAADLTDSTSDTVAGSLVFRFRDVIAPASSTLDADAFQIEYTMRAVNVTANQDGPSPNRINSAVVSADRNGDGDLVDAGETTGPQTVTATIVEPVMSLDKAAVGAPASLVNLDAGDTIVYTLTFANSGTSTAQDLLLTDTLPTGMSIQSIDSVVLTGSATADVAVSGVGTSSLAGEFTVPVGGQVVVTYTVVLDNTVTPGTDYTNGAQIVWSSLDGADPDERTGADGPQGGGTLNDYSLTDEVTASTDTTFDLVKSVDKAQATIGEILTYTLTLTLNEGTTNNVVLVDTLPVDSGVLQLEFLPSSGTIAFGTAATTISGSGTPVVSGSVNETLTFNLGNVLLPSDAAADTITITYQVVVKNVLTNQSGDVESNSVDGSATGVTPDTGNTTNVTIVEPNVTVAKSTTSVPVDPNAGDTVSYQVLVNSTGPVDAFDVTFSDALPAQMSLQTGTFTAIRSSDNANVSAFFTVTATGVVNVAGGFDLAAGDTITIAYDAVISATVTDGLNLVNSVGVEWTSLDGNAGEERTGDGDPTNTPVPGDLNNYEVEGSATVVANLSPAYAFTKEIIATSATHTGTADGTDATITDLAIGEEVTYQLTVTVGEGTTLEVSVSDVLALANGALDIRSVTIASVGSNLTLGSQTITTTDSNADTYIDQVLIDFGTVVNDAVSALPANAQIVIEVKAVAVNDLVNQELDVINNAATLSYREDNNADGDVSDVGDVSTITDDVDVEIVEPTLTVTETITSIPVNPGVGDTVGYEIVVTNTSTVDSFELTFSNIMPPELLLTLAVPADFTAVRDSDGADVSAFFVATPSGVVNVSGGQLDLEGGDFVTINYNAVIQPGVTNGQNIVNQVDIEWTSLQGGDPDERTGDGDFTATDLLDDYEDQVQTVFTASVNSAYDFTKEILSTTAVHTSLADGTDVTITDLVVGETVVYRLTVELAGGQTDAVTVSDILDVANGVLDIRNVSVTAGSNLTVAGSTTALLTDGNLDTFNEQALLNFGTVVNSELSAVSDDSKIFIDITAVVVDVIENQGGDVINNAATLNLIADPLGAATPLNFAADVDVEIVEPTLTVVETITSIPANPGIGDTVAYQVVVDNSGGIDAFDGTLSNILPPELLLQTGTFTAIRDSDGSNVSALFTVTSSGVVSVGGGFDLEDGDFITINYDTVLAGTVTNGQTLNNDVDIEWTSIDGANADERTGDGIPASASDPVDDYEDASNTNFVASVGSAYGFAKEVTTTSAANTSATGGTDPTIEDLVIGEEVTYQLTVDTATGLADNVLVTDILNLANGLLDIRTVTVTSVGSNLTLASQVVSITNSNAGSDPYDDQFTVDFGTVVNSGVSAVSADSRILIEVTAVVVDVIENQDGDVINNAATLTLDADTTGDGAGDSSLSFDADVDVEIVEPTLTVTETIASIPASPGIGDTVGYQIVIDNSSGVDAFDGTLSNVLPTELVLQAGTFTAIRDSDGSNVSALFTVTPTGVVSVSGGFDLADGDFITINYDAVIATTVTNGQALTNPVDIEWTSIDGVNPDERKGDEIPASASDLVDDYEAEDDTVFSIDTIPDYEFTKTILTTSAVHTSAPGGTNASIEDLVIGETVTYRLGVTLALGQADEVTVSDILDLANGILDIRNVALTIGSNLALTTPTPVITDSNADTYDDQVLVNFGTVTNSGSSNVSDASRIYIDITAMVVNIQANQQEDVINNVGNLTLLANLDEGALRDDLVDISDNVQVEIVEPIIDVTKSVNDPTPQLGDVIIYTLLVENSVEAATTDAFDLNIIDTLPAGLVMVPGSVALNILGSPANPSSILTDSSTATGVAVLLDRLDEGESVEIVYSVVVTSNVSFIGTTLVNNVAITHTSLPSGVPGIAGEERGGTADVTDPNDHNSAASASVTLLPPDPEPLPPRGPAPEKDPEPLAPEPVNNLFFDLNQNFLFERGNLAKPGDFWSQQLNKHLEEPKVEAVQAGYIVSGLTQPGTTVNLVVYNDKGEVLGTQTTVADTGGNWMATFNSSKVGEIPARVVIKQTSATQNAGADSGYDLRTYFAPASSTGTYYSETLTPENVMRKRNPSAVVDLYKAAGSTIRLSWNGSSYEFATQGGQLNGSGN